MKKGLVIGVATLVCVAGLSATYINWRFKKAKEAEVQRFHYISELATAGQLQEAYDLIQARPPSYGAIKEEEWTELEISILEKLDYAPSSRLAALYGRSPEAFATHEIATLRVARSLLESRDLDTLKKLRVAWFGKETRIPDWYQIDIDALIATGHKNEAEKVLTSTSLPGTADAERLIRLALLKGKEDEEIAIHYLSQAIMVDPDNGKALTLRGQIFEARNDHSRGLLDYQAALASNPQNHFYRDQLAEFYRRYGRYDQALEIWSAGLNEPAPRDFLELKTIFWSRMVRAVPIPEVETRGDLEALLGYIKNIPAGTWNDDLFAQIPEARRFEQTRQEVFWLKVFAAIKQRDEGKVLALLTYNPFQERSWNPELERALLRIASFRSGGILRYPLAVTIKNDFRRTSDHPWFQQLDQLTNKRRDELPEEIRELLDGALAYSAAFLAAGWREAALQLAEEQIVPAIAPAWLAYEMGQAYFVNRGPEAALKYIARYGGAVPQLEMLRAEILMAKGEAKEAAPVLQASLPHLTKEYKERGLLLLAVALTSQGAHTEARALLEGAPETRESKASADLLSRINKVLALAETGGLAK